MSDDLISRKTIKSQIETIRDCWAISPYVSSDDMKLYAKVFNVVLRTISDCRIAFDKEKVIEELYRYTAEECELHECGIRSEYCNVCMAKKAIEIVEKGGIE